MKPGTPEAARRYGVIDVGSNSVRLLVAEIDGHRGFRLIDDEKVTVRLGAGLDSTGKVSAEAVPLALETITRFRRIAMAHGVHRVRAVATAAVREANNGPEFATLVADETGVELDVLSEEEEARLAYRSVAGTFDLNPISVGVTDIGGGSAEVVVSFNGVIEHVCSLPLGAVRLTDRFGPWDGDRPEALDAMLEFIDEELERNVPRPGSPLHVLFAVGGTARTVGSISMRRGGWSWSSNLLPIAVRGHDMTRSEIRGLLRDLAPMTIAERAQVPGLPADRADILVAGIAIIHRLMKRLRVKQLRIHDGGVREGALLSMVEDDSSAPSGPPPSRLESARRFAETCRYDERHGQHVAKLALHLFDQIVEQLGASGKAWASPESRELLEAAALLHDIGHLIGYSGHHKHAYHLITQSRMSGFSRRELDIVANVARYHRGAEPKPTHSNLTGLTEADIGVVRGLASVLRLAGGLDRTRTQSVQEVRVTIEGTRAHFRVFSTEDPSASVWEAERRADLFESEFGIMEREWSFELVSPEGGPDGGDDDSEPHSNSSPDTGSGSRTDGENGNEAPPPTPSRLRSVNPM